MEPESPNVDSVPSTAKSEMGARIREFRRSRCRFGGGAARTRLWPHRVRERFAPNSHNGSTGYGSTVFINITLYADHSDRLKYSSLPVDQGCRNGA
jgi:hypothetical protein